MNKIFLGLCLFLLATITMTACIPMPNRPMAGTTEGTSPVTYRFEGGADMTSLFGLKATYTAANGRMVTEQIKSLPWSKKIAVLTPFSAQLNVKFEQKVGFPQQASYAVGYSGSIDFASSKATSPPLCALQCLGIESNCALHFPKECLQMLLRYVLHR